MGKSQFLMGKSPFFMGKSPFSMCQSHLGATAHDVPIGATVPGEAQAIAALPGRTLCLSQGAEIDGKCSIPTGVYKPT